MNMLFLRNYKLVYFNYKFASCHTTVMENSVFDSVLPGFRYYKVVGVVTFNIVCFTKRKRPTTEHFADLSINLFLAPLYQPACQKSSQIGGGLKYLRDAPAVTCVSPVHLHTRTVAGLFLFHLQ